MSTETANDILARFTGSKERGLDFPVSRKIDGAWFDIACDGHRLLAIEATAPHYSTEHGAKVEKVFVRPARFGLWMPKKKLVHAATVCPMIDGIQALRLRQGKIRTVVDNDLVIDALNVCGDAVSVALTGPLLPTWIQAEMVGTKTALFAMIMPLRHGRPQANDCTPITYHLPGLIKAPPKGAK